MFCPVCRDEYRSGFTRCATCDADLVESLDASATVRAPVTAEVSAPAPHRPMATYCGFVALEEALHARTELRRAGIPSEVLIRSSDESPDEDEFWLRVPADLFAAVQRILGYDEAGPTESAEGGDVRCSACGDAVAEDADRCPHCGERFEEA